MLSRTGWAIAAIVTLVLAFAGISLYGYANALRNQGVEYEARISATYENNQNVLSATTLKIYEALGLANRKTAAMDSIIRHAVEGRYGESGFSSDGAMFSAVMEAYPDLNALSIFDRLTDLVVSERETFKNEQTKLRDQVRQYEVWMQSGIIRSMLIGNFFPSQRLEARIGGRVVARGPEALDRIRAMILAEGATRAYETGTLEPIVTDPAPQPTQ